MNKADSPQFMVFANEARRGLVHVAVGSGITGYDVTPEDAEALADALRGAAQSAREAIGAVGS